QRLSLTSLRRSRTGEIAGGEYIRRPGGDRVAGRNPEYHLRDRLRPDGLSERSHSRKRKAEVYRVRSLKHVQVVAQTFHRRVASRLSAPRVERSRAEPLGSEIRPALHRVASPEVIQTRSKLLSEQRGPVSRRGSTHLVYQTFVDRPTMRPDKRERVAMDRAGHSRVPDYDARARVHVELSVYAVRV